MKPLALALVAAAVAAVVLVAAEKEGAKSPQTEADVKSLKDAGIEASDEGLLKFVVGLRPTPEARGEIKSLVAKLGSDSFTEREQATRRLAALSASAKGF